MCGPIVAVIMVNPSTADACADDATIRRVIGFGKRLGWSRVIVGNVFAYRATDVCALSRTSDPVGPDNAAHLLAILSEADVVIVAWGSLAKLPSDLRDEWRNVCALADNIGKSLMCLDHTKSGQPRHPLMLSYESRPVAWQMP